jgi:hypothetical protein
MKHVVYLVQKGLISNQVVSGKSGKNYGTAVHVPARGGVVLRMTMEEYTSAKDDIMGNTTPNQQWVPGIPSGCKLGPGGGPADAEFIWDRHLFCRGHSPSNASPIDADVIPLSQQPPAPAPKDDPEPKPPAEQPVVMPPPPVGDESPKPAQVPGLDPAAPGESSRSVVTHEGVHFEFVEGAVRVGKTKLSTHLLETLGNNEPNPDVWFRIVKREGDGLLLLESKKLEPKAEPKEIPPPGFVAGDEQPPQAEADLEKMPYKELQKLAKERGANLFKVKGREKLAAWVREHPAKPDA